MTLTLEHLGRSLEKAWVQREPGVFAWLSGVGLPTMNGVLAEGAEADPVVVSALLDRLSDEAVPYCLQARPAAIAAFSPLADDRRLARVDPIPIMTLDDPAALSAAADTAGLITRRATRADIELTIQVVAAGFEAPEEPFRELMVESVLDLSGVRAYLGYCDGQPVATGMGVTIGDFVAVFNISTLPAYRGRGFGAAMTARAVLDGLGAGAGWAWLQSTPSGRDVYRRLGFQDVEEWACWVSGD